MITLHAGESVSLTTGKVTVAPANEHPCPAIMEALPCNDLILLKIAFRIMINADTRH